MTEWVYIIDLIGTLVFAISGAIIANREQMDPFGAFVLGFVTAVGGGTIRDLLIGSTPVGWMLDTNYLVVIGTGILLAVFFKRLMARLQRTLFLFDAIGLGLFTVLGLQKTLDMGLSPAIAILMGTVSASFGGVVRDVLSDRVPLIFREEIYASVSLLGGLFYLGLCGLGAPHWLCLLGPIFLIIVLRIAAVRYKWSLPTLVP